MPAKDRNALGQFRRGHNCGHINTKPNAGSFTRRGQPGREGGTPPTPIGHTRLDTKTGEVMVKVAGRHPYFPDRPAELGHYVRRAVAVFEKAHGPVPRGMVVLRIDGNRRNDDPDNLCLVTRSVLATLNRGRWCPQGIRFRDLPRERDVRLAAIMTAVARTLAREAGREGRR